MSRDMRNCNGTIEAILRGGMLGAMVSGLIHAFYQNDYFNLLLFSFFVWIFFRADYGFAVRASFAYITHRRPKH